MTENTHSICPICYQTIKAKKVQRGKKTYLIKECPIHGKFEALIWDSTSSQNGCGDENLEWKNWKSNAVVNRPEVCDTKVDKGCPHDCGLCENHEQQACCVLIEITKNCDQNCPYCFASAHSSNGKIGQLSLAEIKEIFIGLKKRTTGRPFNIQISGGEPTLHEDLLEIIKLGKEMGFPYIQLNTNGQRIAKEPDYANKLVEAGLSSVFLQFDGTTKEIYEKIRGQDLINLKERVIKHCEKAKLGVTLVVTVVPRVNDGNLGEILRYGVQRIPTVRGIHFQPVSYFGRFPKEPLDDDRMTLPQLIMKLVDQSQDKIQHDAFFPLETGHPMCSFHGNFVVMEDGSMPSISGTIRKKTCSCGEKSIEKARDYIAKKWTYQDGPVFDSVGENYNFSSCDEFLRRRYSHGFSITAMAFQDAWNLDLQRLKKCRVHVALKDDRLIPFCAYNIIHREKKEKE